MRKAFFLLTFFVFVFSCSYAEEYIEVTSAASSSTDTDEKSKVSANDTTAGYLNGKLVAGSNVTFTENNDGGNETLTISATSSGGGGGTGSNWQWDKVNFWLEPVTDNLVVFVGSVSANSASINSVVGSKLYMEDFIGTAGQVSGNTVSGNTVIAENLFDATGLTRDIELFKDRTYGASENGNSLYIYRNGAFIRLYNQTSGAQMMESAVAQFFDAPYFDFANDVYIGRFHGTGAFSLYFDTVLGGSERWARWILDTDGWFKAQRQDANVNGMDIQMPFRANSITSNSVSFNTAVASKIYAQDYIGAGVQITCNSVSFNTVNVAGKYTLPLHNGVSGQTIIYQTGDYGIWQTPSAGGTSGGWMKLPVQSAALTDNSVVLISKGSSPMTWKLIFPDAQGIPADNNLNSVSWQFKMPSTYTSGLTANVYYNIATQASVTFNLDASLWALSDGDSASVNTESFDTINSGTETSPATATYPGYISISLTNNDSIAAGDLCVFKLARDANSANDNSVGNLEVRAVELTWN